jgi:hypothetical protein
MGRGLELRWGEEFGFFDFPSPLGRGQGEGPEL